MKVFVRALNCSFAGWIWTIACKPVSLISSRSASVGSGWCATGQIPNEMLYTQSVYEVSKMAELA